MASLRIGPKNLGAAVVVVVCLTAYFAFVPARFGDFRAFYCSGRAVVSRSDPYREHPLRDCERAVMAPGISRVTDDVAIPAPFPGYALALFAVVSLLPFGAAAATWLVGSLVAVALSTLLLTRCVKISLTAAVIAVGFPAVAAAVRMGQAMPFVTLGMILAAYLLIRGKPWGAALAALAVALEPHVAPAMFAALFIGERRMRAPLVLGALTLLVISLVTLGVATNIEYVRDVLPAHALANVPDLTQFSVAHFVYVAGADPSRAALAGSLWYIAAASFGVLISLKLRARYGVAALVFVPPAFEVFGGLHVHLAQLAIAVPAFFLVVAPAARFRRALVAVLFFAAMPWLMIVNFPMLVPAIAILGIGFAVAMEVEGIACPLATGASLLTLILFRAGLIGVDHAPLPVLVHSVGNPLADVSWSVLMRARDGLAPVAWYVAAKVPTLAAVAVLLTVLAGAALRHGFEQASWPLARANRKVRAAFGR